MIDTMAREFGAREMPLRSNGEMETFAEQLRARRCRSSRRSRTSSASWSRRSARA